MYIRSITRQRRNIGHAGIHISRPDSMSDRLILLDNRFVGLTVFVFSGSITALIQKEFGLIEVFLITDYQI